MARIPEAELQHLKAAVPLVAVVKQQGRQMFKKGKDFTVLCPFHEEKTPSMVIAPAKNLYHCFGCDAGGSVLDWLMHTEKLSLRKAVERLRAELGDNPAVLPLVTKEEPALFAEDEAGRQALLGRVVDFYHHTLLNAPEAVAYLEKRRLNHPELVAQFRLGFASRTLGYRLPPKSVQAGAKIRARLQAAGVLRESGHEHFTGSLVVPVVDLNGQIREMYGRKITDRLRKGTPLHLYLPGPHGGVWNGQALAASSVVILCESLIDAMSFWVAGYRNVTAAYGVNGFTEDHRRAFAEHGVKQVLIAYDNDAAGNAAAVKLAAELAGMQIDCFRIVFPAGVDANAYLCRVSEAEAAFRLLAESAQPVRDAVVASGPATAQAGDGVTAGSSLAAGVAALPAVAVAVPGIAVERLTGGDLQLDADGWRWQIRGFGGVKAGAMKVSVQMTDRQGGVMFADGVDLMSARSRAGYALKLLQSDGELTIASTGKDDATGNLVTKQYTVKGPVMLMLTTTAIDVDEELLNRCLVLTVNESREQTEAIHALQRHRQTLEGLLMESEKGYLTGLHQNAQRLLRPLKVVNPFASQLTFLSDKTRTRRDHMKYLTLIQSVALLHQYQREVKTVSHRGQVIEYIEVERPDIILANRLAHEILGRTLDEMPPQTRKLLLLIQGMVNQLAHTQSKKPGEVRFTRRDIRNATQWSDSQLKLHCLRLTEMEYLLIHGGSRGHLLQYELLWDGTVPEGAHLCGLIEPESSEKGGYDLRKSGAVNRKSGSGLPHVGAKSGSGKPRDAAADKASPAASRVKAKSTVPAKPAKRITS
ncbi:CHC2 zinc finger domain-containing protein [Erwinia tracheiphila]|uniref:Toprim domain-containing protein n=1 Tax=Erwinia tracheiphila TaxID=65700 RepID=A0A345CUG1_9GAMM|nr:CHC2 zinc finger domain-containing protein [Erwinia tracheiphila]AXF77078.1 toprim domain-containing protein [Erwinia tracheiphila]UIA84236.1 CHC2 zinc finger domain-containing protein [Erwinia tracheiphila]